MTRGVVIFAFDNNKTKYTSLASWSAARIQQYLNLPVTLVTDKTPVNSHIFDHVIVIDRPCPNGTRIGTWYNQNRFLADRLTPYSQTLLLDADYVVASNQLLKLFDTNQDILAMRWAYDVTNRRDFTDLNYFGRNSMPSAWATVLYWRKSPGAKLIFDMIEMIQNHWGHYKNLYGIKERNFRNDYALSIALNTVMGHTGKWPTIPWTLATVDDDVDLAQINQDEFEIAYNDSHNRPCKISITRQDFHAMGKQMETWIAN